MTHSLAGAKCQPGFLRTAEQSADHAVLDYETLHPWESILAPDYFLPAARRLCDQKGRWLPRVIRVFRMETQGQAHWWEMAELIVTHAEIGKGVTVKSLRGPMTVGAPEGVGVSKAKPAEPAKKAA